MRIWVIGLGFFIVWSLGAALLAVLWHRLVLRADALWPPFGAFGWYVWEAVKLSLLIAVLTWLLYLPIGLLLAYAPPLLFNFFLGIVLAVTVLMTWLWLRLGLILPAAALGDEAMTMVTSWFETEENAWAIFVLAFVQGVLLSAINAFEAWSLWTGADFFLWPIPALFGLAALSVLYRDRERLPTDT